MGAHLMGWVRGRRGVTSIVLTLVVAGGAVGSGAWSPTSAAGGLVVVLPVMAALVGVWSIIWEVQTRPGTPRFARAAGASASRQMREDANAKIFADRGGFLFAQRHFFVGTGCPPVLLTPDFVTDVMRRRTTEPVLVVTMPGRRFWTYRTEWAWEYQGLTARDVMALLRDKERRRARELERAHVLLDVDRGTVAPAPRQRRPLPREVKQAVFSREGGRCVECESTFEIQYDHIIPWSMGGRTASTTCKSFVANVTSTRALQYSGPGSSGSNPKNRTIFSARRRLTIHDAGGAVVNERLNGSVAPRASPASHRSGFAPRAPRNATLRGTALVELRGLEPLTPSLRESLPHASEILRESRANTR